MARIQASRLCHEQRCALGQRIAHDRLRWLCHFVGPPQAPSQVGSQGRRLPRTVLRCWDWFRISGSRFRLIVFLRLQKNLIILVLSDSLIHSLSLSLAMTTTQQRPFKAQLHFLASEPSLKQRDQGTSNLKPKIQYECAAYQTGALFNYVLYPGDESMFLPVPPANRSLKQNDQLNAYHQTHQ